MKKFILFVLGIFLGFEIASNKNEIKSFVSKYHPLKDDDDDDDDYDDYDEDEE